MAIERFMVPGELEPVSHYCHVVKAGDFIYLSGMVGMTADGTIPPDTVGQFEIALRSIDTCLRHAGGRPEQVVKVLGMVNCAPGFTDTPKVMHGFSELLYEVLGERGRHARSAVGMQALPGDVPIEVETIFEIE